LEKESLAEGLRSSLEWVGVSNVPREAALREAGRLLAREASKWYSQASTSSEAYHGSGGVSAVPTRGYARPERYTLDDVDSDSEQPSYRGACSDDHSLAISMQEPVVT